MMADAKQSRVARVSSHQEAGDAIAGSGLAGRGQGDLPMSVIRRFVTEEEFNACLRAERVILFFWVPWSCYARDAEAVVASWAESDRPPAEVIRVEPDEQPFVVRWLAEQGKDQLATAGSGAVAWVKSGTLVADLMSPLRSGPEG
jgi:hypothetical protein